MKRVCPHFRFTARHCAEARHTTITPAAPGMLYRLLESTSPGPTTRGLSSQRSPTLRMFAGAPISGENGSGSPSLGGGAGHCVQVV